jgi:uroporphyrinogen III methyltransferase/synthase
LGDIYPNEYDWVTFTSASCVDSFRSACELSGFSAFSDVRALCIGPQTAKAAEKLGMKVSISEVTTIDAMADFLQVQGANLPGGMEETKE